MPRGPEQKRDELRRQLESPTYEQELRGTAHWLRAKADAAEKKVEISPEYARWIACRLENHADDVEMNRG